MPNKKSALKALKQSQKRQARNRARKNHIKNLKRKLEKAIAASQKEEAIKLLSQIYKAIDTAAQKKTLPKNTAARKKSRLAKKVNHIK